MINFVNTRHTCNGVAWILRCLLDGDSTLAQLSNVSGLQPATVRGWLHALAEAYVVRVIAYTDSGAKVWAMNPDYLEHVTRTPSESPKA